MKKSKTNLKSRVLRLLAEEPLDKMQISRKLQLSQEEHCELRRLLNGLEEAGTVARVRKKLYVLPETADLFTGTIQFHANGSAHILSETPGVNDLFIPAEKTSTALHGDRVIARTVSGPQSANRKRSGDFRKEGQVIRILERANQVIVGTLQKSKNFYYIIADDPRFLHDLYVKPPAPPLKSKVGDKVVARLDSWTSRHLNPEGTIIEVLGRAGTPGIDIISILRRYRLPENFPSDVLYQVDELNTEISAEEISRRVDLRDRFIITIDPDDARDFDDAIEVQRTPSGGWSIGVHIADVSHYVRSKTALDREAFLRGNSIYFPGRVIPMLPPTLSDGICSLKPTEERLTFSVLTEVSARGKVHSARFCKSVIRSAARLTYKEAFAILQKAPQTDLEHRVHVAWEVASLLRRQRFARGALDLDFPEVKVWVDQLGRPVRFERIENDISHQLVEELMLLANELTARELKVHKQPTIYRIHEKPDPDRLLEYREQVLLHGLRVGNLSDRDEIQRLLAKLRGSPYEPILKVGLLKSLKRARYSAEPLGHFGLAKANYLHFTSPIRRYADLVTHRALAHRLGLSKSGPSKLTPIADHLSTTERIATDAEREIIKLKKLEYFQQLLHQTPPKSFHAVVFEVRNYGLLIEIPEVIVTGLIRLSFLGDDFFVYDAARGRLVGRHSKTVHKTGDTLDVVVARVDFLKQQVDFKLL
ncbi:MAG: ribonuclease R [Verrucomicrobia bacterium]|nr:MAG: ribonuclease R [Verrucomicrobiota bacterium]